MGQSTDGIICYGVRVLDEDGDVTEDAALPWQAEKFDGDEEDWWRHVSGWTYDREGPWTDEGELKSGVAQEEIDRYLYLCSKWMAANPLPFAVVNYCHIDHPMFILAVPGTVRRAYRGYPESFEPSALEVDSAAVDALADSCREHDIKTGAPSWWLCSYWG